MKTFVSDQGQLHWPGGLGQGDASQDRPQSTVQHRPQLQDQTW